MRGSGRFKTEKETVHFSVSRDKAHEGKNISWHFGYVYYDEFCKKIIDIDNYSFEDVKELSGTLINRFEPGQASVSQELEVDFRKFNKKEPRRNIGIGVSSIKPKGVTKRWV